MLYRGSVNTPGFWKKCYMQSHLIGVPQVFVGFHENGILHPENTGIVDVKNIPTIMNKNFPYEFQRTINRGCKALSEVWRHCKESSRDADERILRVQVRSSSLRIRELSVEEVEAINVGDARKGILPMWFIKGINDRIAHDD